MSKLLQERIESPGRFRLRLHGLLTGLRKYGFYALAAFQTLILLGLYIQNAVTPQSGSDNGSAAMGLFFFILFPFTVLTVAVLIYRFVAIAFVRIVAVLVLILMLVSMIAFFLRDGLPVAA